VQLPSYSAGHRPFRGRQNLTLLSNSMNLVMSMVRGHLIRRALGVGESNLERLVMWKLRSPGRLRRSNDGVDRVRQAFIGAPDKSIPRANAVPDARNDSPQNSSKPRSSTTIQSISPETYNTL